jgi:hypothetical protein
VIATETKGSDQIYQQADYVEILSEYWNNGTHQEESPLPIVEKYRSRYQNTASETDSTAENLSLQDSTDREN